MDKLLRGFFSMKMMTIGLLVFLFGIAVATFLESIYDIQTARLVIYNALWFELLLVYLTINLIINTFRYDMWKKEKIAMLLFHISFVIIMIGAGITRYISFDGIMKLPEPDPQTGMLKPVDYIYSADPRIKVVIGSKYVEKTMYMSEQVKSRFNVDFKFPEKNTTINVELVKFESNRIDSLVVNDSIKDYVLNIVTSGNQSNYLKEGNFIMAGNVPISLEKKDALPGGIELFNQNGRIYVKSGIPLKALPMAMMQQVRQTGQDVPDSMYTHIPADTLVPFNMTTLYYAADQMFVFKEMVQHAKVMRMPASKKKTGSDYITLKFTDGKTTKLVTVEGGMGQITAGERFSFGDLLCNVQYGSVPIQLPFAVACNDFTLHRYPGSDSPSSYESIVSVMDKNNKVLRKQKIFMNNIMDYDGYRFFQSSYYPDETGTVLSVNHDWWGTTITYLGYFIMSLGFVMSIFAKGGRFQELNGKINKIANKRAKAGLSALLILLSTVSYAQTDSVQAIAEESHSHEVEAIAEEHDHQHDSTHNHATEQTSEVPAPNKNAVATYINKEHADKLAYLMVQDYDGRIVPFHTLCNKLLRKINRHETYQDGDNSYNAVQTILSMHMTPDAWLNKPIIYIPRVLRETLGIKGSSATFMELLNEQEDAFKLADEYEQAHRKLEKERSEFDKQLIKLVEKFQVFSEIQMWQYMKIVPVRSDAKNTWFLPFSQEVSKNEKELFNLTMKYFQAVSKGIATNNFTDADTQLNALIKVQREAAGNVAPSKSKINVEVAYNKMNFFDNSKNLYILAGLVLLVIFFVQLFSKKGNKDSKATKIIKIISKAVILITFIYQGVGLGMHWYISGHAPWSDGYGAIVFISWVSILAGFIFAKKSGVILPATCLLAFFMLFVAGMNILDPEITPLIPVLKSYWLMIHVAIITGSYAFLGLGAILAIINLFLYIFRNKENGKVLTWNINELTYVSEMSQTVGIIMLTIGTFLGGVWANESWGRYWAWDPKETWALVSILIYAITLHLRFIPAMKSKFIFNVFSLWSYAAILFTFFGVNFYLVGLHSYAQGDGLGTFPFEIILATVLFYAFTEFASLKNRRYSKQASEINLNYFVKKTVVTIAVFVLCYLAFIIFKVITVNEALEVSWQTAAVVMVTNVLLYIYQIAVPNKPVQLIED